jgi:integration host factor subunit beta
MIKSELIDNIAKKYPFLSYSVVESAVNVILESMIGELGAGGQVHIRGFGNFFILKRKAIMGRNPKTGVALLIGARHVVSFRTGKELKKRVDEYSNQYPIKKLL